MNATVLIVTGNITISTPVRSKGTGLGSVEGKVVLLSESSRQPVGLGKICPEQDRIHGHMIPDGYVKVLIEYIKPKIKPPFQLPFDDDELHCGQFTIWQKTCTTSATYS